MGVTRYTIQIGDEEIEFEGPDNLSKKQIEDLATKQLRTAKPGQAFAHPVYAGTYEPPATPEIETGATGSFFRHLPQGALANFGDEVAAATNAVGLSPLENFLERKLGTGNANQTNMFQTGSFWDAFKHNQDEILAQQRADEEAHGTASTLGSVAGAVSTLPVGGAVAKGVVKTAPLAVRTFAEAHPILTATGVGTGVGAVSGAGAGEGNRAQSAALGAVGGAVVGNLAGTAGQLVPAVARYVGILWNKMPKKEAIGQIVKALKRDGFDVTSPAGIQKLKATLQEYTGKPVSLADIGTATRARTGVGLRSPSELQEQSIDRVFQRQAGQGQRLANDIRANVAPRTDVHAMNDALVEQRAAQAEPLREKALFEDAMLPPAAARPQIAVNEPLDAGVQRTVGQEVPESFAQVPAPIAEPVAGRVSRIVDDPILQQLARLPDAQKALQGALARAESERALLAAQGKDISHLPDLSPSANLDMRTFDYLKRFLDDEVNSLYRRGDTATFKAGQAAQVKNLRDTIRERLREAVPEYGDYLDAYRGSSEMIDALEAGQSFNKLPHEQIAAEQAARSDAGQELYRVGAARNLLDTIRNSADGSTPASRILNSDEARDQLAATGVTPTNLSRINRAVGQERVLSLLPRELQGSATAQRGIAQADADAGIHAAIPFNLGSKTSVAATILRGILNRTSTTRNASVNQELLPRMLETNPAAVQSIIKELEDQGQVAAARQLRRQLLANRTTLFGGVTIGGPVALPGDQ